MSTLNILLLGDAGVGKTTFLTRHSSGKFEARYIPTIGMEMHLLAFHCVVFNILELAGQEKFRGTGPYPDYHPDAIIIMFDVTSNLTWNSAVAHWLRMARSFGSGIPIVLCGNKVDIAGRKVKASTISQWLGSKGEGIRYFDISSKSNYQYEKPFTYIAGEYGYGLGLSEVGDLVFPGKEIITIN